MTVLVRRLAVLGAFGALHVLLQPGEVLWQYAAIGFLVLLPFSYAPRGVNLVVSLAFLAVGSFAGGLAVVPGLLLLGFALSAYGLPRTLPQRPRQLPRCSSASSGSRCSSPGRAGGSATARV